MKAGGRTRRPPVLRWLLVVLAVAGAAYFARHFKKSKKTQYPASAFYEVKRGDMLISIIEEGALRALNETVIRSGLDGLNRIIRLAPEGSQVKKGDLLVEMDSAGLRDRMNELELVYQDRLFILLQAKENLKIQKSLAESQIKDGELRVLNAEDDLEKYRDGEAPLQIHTVEARMGVMKEQVRIAGERYARTQELFKTGNATRSELEADALSLKREELALGQYEEDLRLIKKFDQPNQIRMLDAKVVQAKEDLERLKQRTTNEIAQAEADMKTGQRALDFLDESIKLQKRRLDNAKIFAPQDGLVVYAAVSPFQSGGGNDTLRELNNRFGRGPRGGGPGGGGGFGDSSGEFRGGGGRRGRGGSGSMGGSGSLESSASLASVSANVSAANQRIASAITGASAAESPAAAGGAASASGGARSGGGGGAGGSSGGSGSAGFATYVSMRPSSTLGASTTSSGSGSGSGSSGGGGGGSLSSSSSSMSSSSGSQGTYSGGNQSGQYGSRSQYGNQFGGGGGYEMSSTPGFLEEGTMVRMRQELIRLPDVSKMIAEIKIHESRVGQVTLGMPAYIRVETVPGRHFKGTVRKIAPLPDAQAAWLNPDVKVYPAEILVDEELPSLKPGVSARAEIVITNLTKVLSVPIQTVASLEGEHVCYVKRGSSIVPVAVTTGWFNDRFVEVTSGLKEGDLVLLAAVGDDSIDENPVTGDTNGVQTAAPEGAQPGASEERRRPDASGGVENQGPRRNRPDAPEGGDFPNQGERRMQRRDPAVEEGEAPSEGRRGRRGPGQGQGGSGGRRQQNSDSSPE